MDGLVQNYCMLDNNLKIRPDVFQKLKIDENRRIALQENAEALADDTDIDYNKVRSSLLFAVSFLYQCMQLSFNQFSSSSNYNFLTKPPNAFLLIVFQVLSDQVAKAMKKVKAKEHIKYTEFDKNITKLLNKGKDVLQYPLLSLSVIQLSLHFCFLYSYIVDGGEDEDDLAVTEETNNLVDPLSKATLVDPVITIHCKHRFSRRTIMGMMQGKHAVQ